MFAGELSKIFLLDLCSLRSRETSLSPRCQQKLPLTCRSGEKGRGLAWESAAGREIKAEKVRITASVKVCKGSVGSPARTCSVLWQRRREFLSCCPRASAVLSGFKGAGDKADTRP